MVFNFCSSMESFSSTRSLVISHSVMLSSDGIWYIRSSVTASIIARSPRAPVLRSSALSAIASSASASNASFTPSSSNSFSYCLVSAFFGSFKMRIRASRSNISKDTVTGTRPMNYGIRPNFTKSCGSACFNTSPILYSFFDLMSALKPIAF